MGKLSDLRQREYTFQREEIELLRATSISDSLREWVSLQSAFEWQLQKTAELFEEDRRKALAELQARLYRLVE